MSFLSPLALLMAGLSVPLLLLYFLKVRRREMTVSSLLLWDPALRDREASTFFQRLQRDPLLLLQILALLALTVALARPAITVMGHGDKRVVIVLDTSASMKATDVGPSRFVRAQREALGLLGPARRGRRGHGDRGRRAAAGRRAVHARPRPGVRGHPEPRGPRPAQPARRGHPHRPRPGGPDPRAEIHVFTDGAHPGAVPGQADDVRVRWVGVGQPRRQRGHHQPRRPAELLRGASTRRPSCRW